MMLMQRRRIDLLTPSAIPSCERNGSEFVGFGEVEVFGEDSDDLVGCAADLDGSTGDVGIGVVESLPEVPGEDSNFFVAGNGFFGEEVATEDGLDAEDVEEIG